LKIVTAFVLNAVSYPRLSPDCYN